MNCIVEFWSEWNQLAYLEKRNARNSNIIDTVWCKKWNKESKLGSYDMTFHGYKIKQRFDEQRREVKLDNSSKNQDVTLCSEEVKEILQWPIWMNLIDLDLNLQWTLCSKTYWFDWLMFWMLEKSNWPNWRANITKSLIHPNREWKKFI